MDKKEILDFFKNTLNIPENKEIIIDVDMSDNNNILIDVYSKTSELYNKFGGVYTFDLNTKKIEQVPIN